MVGQGRCRHAQTRLRCHQEPGAAGIAQPVRSARDGSSALAAVVEHGRAAQQEGRRLRGARSHLRHDYMSHNYIGRNYVGHGYGVPDRIFAMTIWAITI